MNDEVAFQHAVAAAIRAPSLHNSQPWRFRLRDGVCEVLADHTRTLPASDPTGWATRIACGAATFNMSLAYAVINQQVEVRWLPDRGDTSVMAALTHVAARPASPAEHSLYNAIPRRHSNRQPFWPQTVPNDSRARLVEAARAESAWLELVTGTAPVGAVAEIAHAANRVLNRNADYVAELEAWTRRADDTNDGVPSAAGGPSPQPQDLFPQRIPSDRDRAPGRDFEEEPLVAILGSAGDSLRDQLTAGYALQRVLLTLTSLGLAASLLSQPIEVAAAREQLRLALGRRGAPQMVLRIGYGHQGVMTQRREPVEVIDTVSIDPPKSPT